MEASFSWGTSSRSLSSLHRRDPKSSEGDFRRCRHWGMGCWLEQGAYEASLIGQGTRLPAETNALVCDDLRTLRS